MKIDKNIPMPAQRYNGTSATLRAMEVGDSFEVVGASAIANIRTIANVYSKREGGKFISRKTGVDTWRVWRIA